MDSIAVANVELIFLCVSLGIGICLIYGPLQLLLVDWARQTIFEARDAVFDFAATGRLSFDSKEYKEIRSTFESMIRYAPKMTWTRWVYWELHFRSVDERSKLTAAICRIEDTELREEIRGCAMEAVKAVILLVVLRSPLILLFGLFAFAGMKVNRLVYEKLWPFAVDVFELFEFRAENAVGNRFQNFTPVPVRTGIPGVSHVVKKCRKKFHERRY